MTNQELYKRFMEYKNKNKEITYKFLAVKLGTCTGNVCDKFTRLKNGQSVNTQFLIDVERVLGVSIFLLIISTINFNALIVFSFLYRRYFF